MERHSSSYSPNSVHLPKGKQLGNVTPRYQVPPLNIVPVVVGGIRTAFFVNAVQQIVKVAIVGLRTEFQALDIFNHLHELVRKAYAELLHRYVLFALVDDLFEILLFGIRQSLPRQLTFGKVN